MDHLSPLVELEKIGRRTRTAARLVAIALAAVGLLSLVDGLNPSGIALLMAAGTVSATSVTLNILATAICDLHADIALDHDIITCQQDVIAHLRSERP